MVALGPAWGALVGLALGAVAAWAGIAYYLASRITRPLRGDQALARTPAEVGAPWRDVAIPHSSGRPLPGWWLEAGGERVVILCTGFRARRDDALGIAGHLWRRGLDVLLFDYASHVPGDGIPVTLGHSETVDALAAVAYARERLPHAPIGLLGYSMGGSVALVAAARSPEVAAVVADCPFACQRRVIAHRFRQVMRLPAAPFLPLTDRLVSRRAGFRLCESCAIDEVARIAPRPVLIIHAAEDTVVPLEHGLALYARAGDPRELWTAPAEHCGVYYLDPDAYADRVAAFFRAADGRERATDTDWNLPLEVALKGGPVLGLKLGPPFRSADEQ